MGEQMLPTLGRSEVVSTCVCMICIPSNRSWVTAFFTIKSDKPATTRVGAEGGSSCRVYNNS